MLECCKTLFPFTCLHKFTSANPLVQINDGMHGEMFSAADVILYHRMKIKPKFPGGFGELCCPTQSLLRSQLSGCPVGCGGSTVLTMTLFQDEFCFCSLFVSLTGFCHHHKGPVSGRDGQC